MSTRDTEPLVPFTVPPWSVLQTESWLTEYPLPADFTWLDRYGKERAVLPTYKVRGYGKWLKDTPYFPGLFEEAHDILARASADTVLSPEWLAEQLNARRPKGVQETLL